MNGRVIRAILRKDLSEFLRNRFFVFITLLVLVAWIAVFWVLPDSVDETVRFGVSPAGLEGLLGGAQQSDSTGLQLQAFADEEALRTAVETGSDGIVAGIVFPPDFVEATAAGERPTVELLVPASLPAQQRLLMEGLVEQIAFGVTGTPPPVDPITRAVVLGTDRIGDQVSLQEQMRPLLLVIVLMVETFALSSLVAVEVQQRTVTAVLATPAGIGDFLAAKGIFGTGLAFGEALVLAVGIGALTANVPVVVLTLLLGAVLVTGFGLFAGAFGRDFLGTLLVAMLFIVPLTIPAFGALFPGSTAGWVKVLPTYGLVETIVGVTTNGETFSAVAPALALLAAWGAGAFLVGTLVLRRRVATL